MIFTDTPTTDPHDLAMLSLAANSTQGASSCIGTQYCVYSEPDLKGNVYLTLHGSLPGWIGLGTGDQMAGSTMIIGWKNSTGGYTISDRMATSESMPQPASTMVSQVVPLRVPAPTWAVLAFTVFKPLGTTYKSDTTYIYSISSRLPITIDSATSSFSKHDTRGNLGKLDFTTVSTTNVSTTTGTGLPVLQLPSNVDYSTIVRIHGYAMLYSWVLAPFVGIFIARYLKGRLGNWWFRSHVSVMVLGVGLGSVSAIILIYLFKTPPHFNSSPSAHPLLGLLVTILMFIQMTLGLICHKLYKAGRAVIPWWNKAHWYLGRSLALFAIATIITV